MEPVDRVRAVLMGARKVDLIGIIIDLWEIEVSPELGVKELVDEIMEKVMEEGEEDEEELKGVVGCLERVVEEREERDRRDLEKKYRVESRELRRKFLEEKYERRRRNWDSGYQYQEGEYELEDKYWEEKGEMEVELSKDVLESKLKMLRKECDSEIARIKDICDIDEPLRNENSSQGKAYEAAVQESSLEEKDRPFEGVVIESQNTDLEYGRDGSKVSNMTNPCEKVAELQRDIADEDDSESVILDLNTESEESAHDMILEVQSANGSSAELRGGGSEDSCHGNGEARVDDRSVETRVPYGYESESEERNYPVSVKVKWPRVRRLRRKVERLKLGGASDERALRSGQRLEATSVGRESVERLALCSVERQGVAKSREDRHVPMSLIGNGSAMRTGPNSSTLADNSGSWKWQQGLCQKGMGVVKDEILQRLVKDPDKSGSRLW